MARHQQATISDQSFNERLVHFWQNHFAISVEKRELKILSSAYEKEAIRPNVMGSFGDMLLAVTMHPAMLLYLDNYKSVGANSKLGLKRKKGINENLAREILELHTLGVDNGYSQQDIIAFANMLTGWSVSVKSDTGFIFNNNAHENEAQIFMQQKYNQPKMAQAKAALFYLANHKNTAGHIAKKLAQHFAGETNKRLTKNLAIQLEESFIKTGGQLKPLYQILIGHEACWQTAPLRFRSPNEWVLAISRASQNVRIKDKALIGGLKNMGHQPYFSGSPAGWPDYDSHWNSPSAFVQKWQIAKQLSRFIKTDPLAFAKVCFGENIDQHSLLAMQRAKNLRSSITLFLLSEQMQYR